MIFFPCLIHNVSLYIFIYLYVFIYGCDDVVLNVMMNGSGKTFFLQLFPFYYSAHSTQMLSARNRKKRKEMYIRSVCSGEIPKRLLFLLFLIYVTFLFLS